MSTINTQKIEKIIWKKLFDLLKQEYLLNEKTLQNDDFLRQKIKTIIQQEEFVFPEITTAKIIASVIYRIKGFGPLQDLINDEEISEIMVNGIDNIFIEKNGILEKTNLSFSSEEELLNVINKIVSPIGRRIDEGSPMVDARLPDGSRVNAIIPPLSLVGPSLTIRKFSKNPFSLEDLLQMDSLDEQIKKFLIESINNKDNIIISGGTGTGKTSLLNALAQKIDNSQRIITIEDSAELQLQHPHLISLESRPANIEGKGEITIRELVKNSLRMRPDRIIVGEIRGAEAIDMLQAMNTGHQGSITTIHANAPLEALLRLETMVLMGNVKLPLTAIRQQIIGAITTIIQLERTKDGHRKISQISQLIKSVETQQTGNYQLKNILS
jgi:pilus assembly protein CpaF